MKDDNFLIYVFSTESDDFKYKYILKNQMSINTVLDIIINFVDINDLEDTVHYYIITGDGDFLSTLYSLLYDVDESNGHSYLFVAKKIADFVGHPAHKFHAYDYASKEDMLDDLRDDIQSSIKEEL